MTIKGVGELGLLERIKPYLAAGATGDDAAVIADGNGFLVVSTDMYVEGVHFDLAWMSARDVGWRSLALALGDLAAKGATPTWALSSIAVPPTWSLGEVIDVYAGMKSLNAVDIVGGDMSATAGPAALSLTVAGRADKRPLKRSDAKPGWMIGVTGPLGGAALALRERRALRLVPRLDEGARLNELGLCCGDISDGLVRELEKFAAMSGCGSELRAADVPRLHGVAVEEAVTSGEEAELVCVGPADMIAAAGLTAVGELTESGAVKVIGADIVRSGYDHFG